MMMCSVASIIFAILHLAIEPSDDDLILFTVYVTCTIKLNENTVCGKS